MHLWDKGNTKYKVLILLLTEQLHYIPKCLAFGISTQESPRCENTGDVKRIWGLR